MGKRRERADFAFAIYRGIVREVYRIDSWYPAVTLDYETRDLIESRGSGRWEFERTVAEDVRDLYVGKLVMTRSLAFEGSGQHELRLLVDG